MRTLTFVPGTMCDARLWSRVIASLGGRIDVRHLPLETALTRPDIHALFEDAASSGPVDFVAFSMGGYFALEFGLAHPDRVRSMILIGSSAFGLEAHEAEERVRAIKLLETHAYRGIGTTRLRQFVHRSHWNDETVIETIRVMDHDLGQRVLIAQLKETSARASLELRLHEVAAKTLVIGADQDELVPFSQIERMHDLIPGSEIAQASNAGHMVPLEQPEWLAEQIARFHGL
jgi:pimeloyl-ACP methyl ester carboxylesterase